MLVLDKKANQLPTFPLSKLQQNYTVMKKGRLLIVATLNEFQSMLVGFDVHLFTNHKNLPFDTLKMQQVLLWSNK
ncbi:LOW QUALITY PROTEIN: hypothetical protein ACHAW6_003440, partial [Cyclotella cf. meneghiniana]